VRPFGAAMNICGENNTYFQICEFFPNYAIETHFPLQFVYNRAQLHHELIEKNFF
jgi:hypothetical protein